MALRRRDTEQLLAFVAARDRMLAAAHAHNIWMAVAKSERVQEMFMASAEARVRVGIEQRADEAPGVVGNFVPRVRVGPPAARGFHVPVALRPVPRRAASISASQRQEGRRDDPEGENAATGFVWRLRLRHARATSEDAPRGGAVWRRRRAQEGRRRRSAPETAELARESDPGRVEGAAQRRYQPDEPGRF